MSNVNSGVHDRLEEIAGTDAPVNDGVKQMFHLVAEVGVVEDWPSND